LNITKDMPPSVTSTDWNVLVGVPLAFEK